MAWRSIFGDGTISMLSNIGRLSDLFLTFLRTYLAAFIALDALSQAVYKFSRVCLRGHEIHEVPI